MVVAWDGRLTLPTVRLPNSVGPEEVQFEIEFEDSRRGPLKSRMATESSRIPKNSGGGGLDSTFRDAPNFWEFGYAQGQPACPPRVYCWALLRPGAGIQPFAASRDAPQFSLARGRFQRIV
jgi:hypothetical protein